MDGQNSETNTSTGGFRPISARQGNSAGPRKKKTVHCRFWGSKSGCRAGDSCPFIHEPSKLPNSGQRSTRRPVPEQKPAGDEQLAETKSTQGPSSSQTNGRRFLPPPVDESRVVNKPVSKAQAEDPRAFQIAQLKRRFSAAETAEDGGTALVFRMVPSDPDFPFEMPRGLECVLHIPFIYPKDGRPWLEVKNEEMEREFQIQVEKGFARLTEKMPQATLLGLMNALDRQLEGLLGGEPQVEITVIPNNHPGEGSKAVQTSGPVPDATQVASVPIRQSKPPDTHTPEQLRLARERRDVETRQLEARLGRSPLFAKSRDGIAFTLPITPRKHEDLPVPLQAVKSVKLFVPQLYPLQNCRVELQGASRDTAIVTEKAFERKAKETYGTSLMGQLNYLAQNMHVLATEVVSQSAVAEAKVEDKAQVDVGESANYIRNDTAMDDRDHVVFIPRPPEWTARDNDDNNEESSESDYSDSYDSGNEDGEGGATLDSVPEQSSTTAPERGVSLSFPSLELYSIELLELTSLCLTIKCTRCKTTLDINNLRDKTQKTESCNKCSATLSVSFRHEFMHANSFRAGYLDLEGCTVVDMLPSRFLPTCSSCSTTIPAPGVVSVRGEPAIAICRSCHHKLQFKLPEVKFLLVSASAKPTSNAPRRKIKDPALHGIVAGTELPRRGRCVHYSKSYRWFRFSCCSKIFPCDRCHDESSDHPNEHANRMVCGWCSREQNYRPEDCGVCRMSLVKKAGSGFWEGGKGTRDKARMSRKDPRKYKRRPGGVARKVKT